jgi:hypothetical protein
MIETHYVSLQHYKHRYVDLSVKLFFFYIFARKNHTTITTIISE